MSIITLTETYMVSTFLCTLALAQGLIWHMLGAKRYKHHKHMTQLTRYIFTGSSLLMSIIAAWGVYKLYGFDKTFQLLGNMIHTGIAGWLGLLSLAFVAIMPLVNVLLLRRFIKHPLRTFSPSRNFVSARLLEW
jgi:hypothetical protein